MPYGDVFTLRHRATIETAITILQLKTGATTPARLLACRATQYGSVTSAQEELALVRKSAAATVTTAVMGTHLFKKSPGGPNPDASLGTAATGVIGTAEGTDGDVFARLGFNVLSGREWVWTPAQQWVVQAAAIVAVKFLVAPASQVWNVELDFEEIG